MKSEYLMECIVLDIMCHMGLEAVSSQSGNIDGIYQFAQNWHIDSSM